MSKLLRFTKTFWATAEAYGGAKKNILRDYDIITMHRDGKTCGEIAIKFNMSCTAVMKIIHKYP